ncbi:helix-turn-helix domain-containing protein [Paracoccus sp. SCSIO 75233]|uniref:winged helix-turn-helix transcriptional regulator n=1 Tax=Paracoccus sp. SCSIO 75233 TaxID=3017782 RepID=UPI0022F10F76|nr:helix-turn-helix domain-containing protein [Paracoccus sp. SCSIO 75233]WBU54377.1 helix-turn-helix domain-containing protein [Paracoccus sp. SCSIO 75233]
MKADLALREKNMPACPVDRLLRVISGQWTSYLLWVLSQNGPQRFGALQKLVPGISTKVLTERLRMLETAGLILREQAATIPPQVTYSLTPRGLELRGLMDDLSVVARRWDTEGWRPPPR